MLSYIIMTAKSKIHSSLKGQCHEVFCFRFFSWITFPQAPDTNIRIISNFFENSQRYSQVKVHHRCRRHRQQNFATSSPCVVDSGGKFATGVNDTGGKFAAGVNDAGGKLPRYQRHRRQICHRCHWHRWQIIGTISGCIHMKVNLKVKIYIYVSSTTQRWPNKIIKNFLIEDFFHLPPVSWTPVANLELRISPRIFEKIRNGLIVILWGWGETDSWKEPEAKISWHCPFK